MSKLSPLVTSLALRRLCLAAALSPALLTMISCSSGMVSASSTTTSTTSTTTSSSTTNAYATAYASLTWASGVVTSVTSNCTMTVTSSGVPPVHNTYYLAPATSGQTVVATTPSGIQLALTPYATSGLSNANKVTATFNLCPSKATSTTATSNGPIGLMTSGEALFNPYEATGTVAMGDNVSYTFTTGGVSYTAYFLDQCDSHAAAGMGTNSGSTWHYHANPVCWTATVDGTGPSHIIGIALDGFPIYGGRDVNGKIVDVTTLDSCNGITSATPEFPSGAYHYVLPLDANGAPIKTKQSSLNCYAGTVSSTLVAAMKKLGCNMPFLLADGNARLPDGREVSRPEAAQWMQQNMGGMQMADNQTMPMTMTMTMPAGEHHTRE